LPPGALATFLSRPAALATWYFASTKELGGARDEEEEGGSPTKDSGGLIMFEEHAYGH